MSETGARSLVFITSASVLVLEILAGRLLAPYVGVTIEAFTGIIGTVLAAIALGSWLGGRAADRGDPRRLLGPLVIGGGLLTLLAPAIVTGLGPALRGTDPTQIVVLTGLAFFAPAVVLSAVTPVVVKLRLADLAQTGTVVGRYSAIGTAGALFGTFVTGFVLLASLPTRPIVLGLGVVLIALGLSLLTRVGAIRTATLMTTLVLTGAFGTLTVVAAGPCDIETTYSCAFVVTDPDRPSGRTLWLDSARHSYVDIDDPNHLQFRYIRLMADITEAVVDGDPRLLAIGGGGFTLPQWARIRYPTAHVTVLELDGRLVDLVEDQLGLGPGDVDQLLVGDARSTIRLAEPAFDVVWADAFGGFVVPWHLTTETFVREISATMADDGVLIMNVIDYPPLAFARAEAATLATVFEHVLVVAPARYLAGESGGNLVLVATDDGDRAGRVTRAIAERAGTEESLAASGTWIGGAPILTDDFAPVDQLISRP